MATLLACSCSGMEACHWCKPAVAPMQDMGQCVRCLAALGRRLWVGLADGRIQVLAERSGSPGGPTVEEDWLAHEVRFFLIASHSCQSLVRATSHRSSLYES